MLLMCCSCVANVLLMCSDAGWQLAKSSVSAFTATLGMLVGLKRDLKTDLIRRKRDLLMSQPSQQLSVC